MTATLAAPPAPAVTPPPAATVPPQPYRWTIAEYRELGKTGLFHDKKTMLLDGVIYVMVIPKPPHDTGLSLILEYLRTAFPMDYYVRGQMGFDIGERTDPGPDAAVVPGTIRDYSSRTPTTAVLIVEVADSSLATDTTTKAEFYATANVPEYWVLDLTGRRLLVYRDPEPLPAGLGATAYRTHMAFGPADSVSPLAAPAAAVRVADLLP